MIRTIKSIVLAIGFLVIISLLIPGCYTQLSRPRVDTDDEYQSNAKTEEVEEYYQDEGSQAAEESRDVYIYNYYPYSWYDYDYWYWSYYPYSWRYIGPYPDYWWGPYGRWTPGWYVGFYYYDYYWGGYPRYYDSYYRYWHGSRYSERNFVKRPFERHRIGVIDRDRQSDSQSSLTKPVSPGRLERPGTTSSTPDVREKSISPDRKTRTVKEMVDQRQRSRAKVPEATEDKKSKQETQERPTVRKPKTEGNSPRSPKSIQKPEMIEQAKPRSTPATPNRNYSTPKRSSDRSSNSASRPTNSGDTRISKPATRSDTHQSSGSTTRSTPTRSSNEKSSSSDSKNSGSSRTKK